MHELQVTQRGFAALVCALVASFTAASDAAADPAVVSQVTKDSRGSLLPDYTVGWDFEVTQEVEVSKLGLFDMKETSDGSIGDGLFEAHQLGIWDSTGTLQVSATVPAGDAAPLVGHFRTVAVDPIRLLPGESYLIGAHYPSSCNILVGGGGDCVVHFLPPALIFPANFTFDPRVRSGGLWRFGAGFGPPLGASERGSREGFGPSFFFEAIGSPVRPPNPPDPPQGLSVLEDPRGDVYLFEGPLPPGSPAAPDIVEVTAGFTEDALVLTVSFAAGTMQPGVVGTFYVLGLDLDLDARTGGSFIPGADTLLFFATDLTFATICDEIVTFETCHTRVGVTTQGDSLSVVLALDASGIHDDGVALFGFVAALFLDGVPVAEDAAFDGVSESLARTLLTPTGSLIGDPVPEPASPTLVLVALLALCGLRSPRARARPTTSRIGR